MPRDLAGLEQLTELTSSSSKVKKIFALTCCDSLSFAPNSRGPVLCIIYFLLTVLTTLVNRCRVMSTFGLGSGFQ